MLLIMIYHLKAILSIKDIGVLFHVALAEPDAEKQAQQIETIYAGFVALQKSTYAYLANMAENKADDSFYGKDIMLGCEDRERWEKEIDWMALHGINLSLCKRNVFR